MPVKLGTGTIHFKCVSSCFYKCFFFFFLFCTSISCNWSDSHRHLCCLDTQYVMDARKLCVSPLSPYVFVHFHIKIFPHPIFPFSFISFLKKSLLTLQTFRVICIRLWITSQPSNLKKEKIQMARHPFKNPLKALVTFWATFLRVWFFF